MERNEVVYLRADDDFARVQWADPRDAERTWLADRHHCPTPIPPLCAEMFAEWCLRAMDGEMRFVNGFAFLAPETQPVPGHFDQPAVAVWDAGKEEETAARARAIREQRYDEGDPAAALAGFEAALDQSCTAFKFTIDVIGDLIPVIGPFLELCGQVLGPDGALEAMTIARSGGNATIDSALGLERLAEVAEGTPEVHAAIIGGVGIDRLRGVPAASEFVRALDAYLAEWGWRGESWVDIHRPLWVELPAVPLGIVRRYLEHPGQRPSRAVQQAAPGREAALARVRAEADAETRARFEALLPGIDGCVRVIEERAALQQTAFGSMKVPILALGRALVAAGVVGSPGDAFYLTRAELRALASGQGAGFDARAIVEGRKGELVGWGRLLPPAFVGAPPGEIDNGAAASVVQPPAAPGSLRGIGASRGIAHGRAFVARSLDEAERLEPGDILVCVFTSPPWTPLFAIAGGIVCDAGGVLGHAAITAREYGIPAVLGTHTATRDIPHGAMITIDGAAGTVTIGA